MLGKIKFLLCFIFAMLCLWIGGLVCFAYYTLNLSGEGDTSADISVVLTGDAGRLTAAARLLRKNNAEILFISGVGGGAELDALTGSDILTDLDKQKIYLGRSAENTRENALETAAFLEGKDIHSILLVTSYYHIPRSVLEFKRVLPEMIIKPYPVFHSKSSYKSFKLLIKEYNKFVLSFIRAKSLKIIGLE